MNERIGEEHRRMSEWAMCYTLFDPEDEPTREALTVTGNGYFCSRGSLETATAGEVHYPGTYLAGGYNRASSTVSGRVIHNEDLVNWPNWMLTTFRLGDGDWFDLSQVQILDYRHELDVRRGLLTREIRFRDDQKRTTRWTSRRFTSMGEAHFGAIEWTIEPEDWSGRLEIRSALDGTVSNSGVARYRDLNGQHLRVLEWGVLGDETMLLTVETNQSEIRMTQAARTQAFSGGQHVSPKRVTRRQLGFIAQDLQLEVQQGEPLRLEKIVSIHTSRDFAVADGRTAAVESVQAAESFAKLLETHERKWRHIWKRFDIELDDSVETSFILRLHIFHLMQTVSANSIDLDTGVPARGWHGEAYRGHIFWDELFIFPFINFRIPELTRSLLMYRFRRLPQARQLAARSGYQGAMFPWQSGSDGREESQVLHLNPKTGDWVPDNTHRQRHVNAAIAYNVWQYYQVTGDVDFMSYHGGEMIIEIARFFASLVTFNDQRDRYDICNIVGPDEFHTKYPDTDELGVHNNTYTNVMVSWVLQRAAQVLDLVPSERAAELKENLGISDETLKRFDRISRQLFIPFHDGILSQFEGYEELKDLDWDHYLKKYGDIHRLDRILPLENDTINRYKASKQADVLMLFYLFSEPQLEQIFKHLGYDFTPEMMQRNIDYYLQRTSHGSTLSRVVESWVLARSDRKRSWDMFCDALRSDVSDVQGGTTSEGIHLGAMAGTVDLIQRCYTAVSAQDDILWFNPRLPDELGRMKFRINYRGHWLTVEIDQHELDIAVEPDIRQPIRVGYQDEVYTLSSRQHRRLQLKHKKEPAERANTAEREQGEGGSGTVGEEESA